VVASITTTDRIDSRSAPTLSRRELLTWTALALLANQALHVLEVGNFKNLLSSLASLNLVYWLAAGVIVWRLSRSDAIKPATGRDKALAIGCGLALCATGLISYRMGAGLVATVAAFAMMRHAGDDAELRAAGTVLLALATHLAWGPILFQLTTQELIGIDAGIVMAILKLVGSSVTLKDGTFYAANGHTMTMIGGCSSFMNMSIALLACVTITMALRTRWHRHDASVLIAMCATMVLVNAFRIVLFTGGPAAHAYWHDGPGSSIFVLVQTALIALLGYGGALWAARQARP
jgi:Transmembrane exosortase (Exosortase_EpsH)